MRVTDPVTDRRPTSIATVSVVGEGGGAIRVKTAAASSAFEYVLIIQAGKVGEPRVHVSSNCPTKYKARSARGFGLDGFRGCCEEEDDEEDGDVEDGDVDEDRSCTTVSTSMTTSSVYEVTGTISTEEGEANDEEGDEDDEGEPCETNSTGAVEAGDEEDDDADDEDGGTACPCSTAECARFCLNWFISGSSIAGVCSEGETTRCTATGCEGTRLLHSTSCESRSIASIAEASGEGRRIGTCDSACSIRGSIGAEGSKGFGVSGGLR